MAAAELEATKRQAVEADVAKTADALAFAEKQAKAAADRAAAVEADFAELEEAYVSATAAGTAPLPADLVDELEAFADANPGLLTYDAASGVVRFESDVTFAPGSADLTPAAKAAAERLAVLLNGSAASDMDVMVAGHTDSKPVTRQSTVKRGHKDNWYLSSHRAIAVSKALEECGR